MRPLALLLALASVPTAPAHAASVSYQPQVNYDLTATFASGQTTTGEVDLAGTMLVGVILPSTFDGTAMTLSAAPAAGGTFVSVQNGAATPAAVTLTTSAASTFIPLAAADRDIARGLRFIKFTAATQTGSDTVLTLVTIPTK